MRQGVNRGENFNEPMLAEKRHPVQFHVAHKGKEFRSTFEQDLNYIAESEVAHLEHIRVIFSGGDLCIGRYRRTKQWCAWN